MPTDKPDRRVLDVFVASPGDVQGEREKTREILLALNRQAHYRKKFVIVPYFWDDPHAPTPMSYPRTPEDSVVHYGERPSHCDLLIGILKHRLGSPLPTDRYGTNPDGDPFTGTEWEIHDAVEHPNTRTDDVFVFVSNEPFALPRGLDAAERTKRQDQYNAVEHFLERLQGPDGGYRGGVNAYENLEDFGKRLRSAVENWLEHLEGPEATRPSDEPPPAAPPGSAAKQAPRICFQLDTGHEDIRTRVITRCEAPVTAVLTSRDELEGRVVAGEYDALAEVLLGTHPAERLRNLAQDCLGRPATDPLTHAGLRIRIVTADPALAALPWHCLSLEGRAMAEAGWVFEAIATSGAEDTPEREIPIENPLILAPSDPTLEIGAARHCSEVEDALRALLGGRGQAIPWARTLRELEFCLKQDPPDLIYAFTRLDRPGGLTLGLSESDRARLAFAELARLIAGCGSKPILWLNLIAAGRGPRTWALPGLEALLAQCHALLLQHGTIIDAEAVAERGLTWLDQLQDGERDLATVLARSGDAQSMLTYSEAPLRLRLPAVEDSAHAQRARIRAELLKVMLGREPEKNLLHGYTTGAGDGELIAYAAVGDDQACVHDFPAQVRHRLEQRLEDGLRVVTRYVLAPIRASAEPGPEIPRLFRQHLLPMGGRPDEALEGLLHSPPLEGETVVIALPWLLDVTADVMDEQLARWLEDWAAFHADHLTGMIPEHCRLLLGACLRLGEGCRLDSERVLQTANAAIEDGGRGTPNFQAVQISHPLGKLTADHLHRFYGPNQFGARLLPRDIRRDVKKARQLAEWIIATTESRGGFADTVDLVYQEYRNGYPRFQREQRRP
jgi:hypothetical protein